jgi:peptide/nickel transport system substrate-binding protein
MRVALFVAGVVIGLSTLASMAQERMLKVAGPWEIAGIDPAQSGYVFSRLQVAETLVSADATGNLVPGLAENGPSATTG